LLRKKTLFYVNRVKDLCEIDLKSKTNLGYESGVSLKVRKYDIFLPLAFFITETHLVSVSPKICVSPYICFNYKFNLTDFEALFLYLQNTQNKFLFLKLRKLRIYSITVLGPVAHNPYCFWTSVPLKKFRGTFSVILRTLN
jgi:hypothetical protein